MDDYVYFGGWDGFMYKFEKRSGKLVWRFQGGGSDSGVAIGFEGKILMPGDGMKCIDAETQMILWIPKIPRENFNVTPAYHDGRAFISALYGGGLGGLPIASKIVALDASNGEPFWTFDGPGGLTGPIIGNNGYVYCGSTTNPYFFAISAKGNSDGTTDCLFKVKMANKVEESTAAIYNGKAYILSSGGFLYAIE
jgi:outer membrane protein assembly factor BamB